MFKSVLATAAATLVAITFGASAYAGGPGGMVGSNGISLNGMSLNGMGLNGVKPNGMSLNGITANGWANGIELNGTAPAASSFAIDGIELPALVR